MLDYNILMLVHPSNGDNIFYKVRDDNSIILTDSFGNEPYGKKVNHFCVEKKRQDDEKSENEYKTLGFL